MNFQAGNARETDKTKGLTLIPISKVIQNTHTIK